MACFSHLLNNCGNELASREIDRFAGHLLVILAHSHNAKDLWRREAKVAPPKPVSHRWSSRQLWNETLVQVWPEIKTFVDKSTSTEQSKSKAVQALRYEMGRDRPDGIHQELVLQVEIAIAVDAGIFQTPATHLLEEDGCLVSKCCRVEATSFELATSEDITHSIRLLCTMCTKLTTIVVALCRTSLPLAFSQTLP